MIVCQYGTGCNRPDCIYEHPYGKDDGKGQSSANSSQSREPCMAYLAGMCTFSASGCRKRHPPPIECERYVAKYGKVKCRFADSCMTKGCLYMHPGDEGYDDVGFKTNAREPTYLVQEDMAAGAFPPLGASGSGPGTASASAGNWKPSPVGGNVQQGSHASSYGTNVHHHHHQQQQQQQYAAYQQQYCGQGDSSQQYGMQSAYGQGYGYEGQGQMMGAVGAAHAHAHAHASAQTFHQHHHLPQQQYAAYHHHHHHHHHQQQQQCETGGCGPLAGSRRTDDNEFPPLSSS